jgi:hypothetical protein
MPPVDEFADFILHAFNLTPDEAHRLSRLASGPRFDDRELRED